MKAKTQVQVFFMGLATLLALLLGGQPARSLHDASSANCTANDVGVTGAMASSGPGGCASCTPEGSVFLDISVTAQNGTGATRYCVTIHRPGLPDIVLGDVPGHSSMTFTLTNVEFKCSSIVNKQIVVSNVVIAWNVSPTAPCPDLTFPPGQCHKQDLVVQLETTPPVVTPPPNITIGTGGVGSTVCSATVDPGTATATDNCTPPAPSPTVTGTRSDSLPLNDPYPLGTTTITWTATDGAGNVGTATQTVTVIDDTPPVITCPGNMFQAAPPNQCEAQISFTVPATDNCDPTPTVICTPPSGSTFSLGTTTVTCTASDASAHSADAMCSFTVTVTDTTPPVLSGLPTGGDLGCNPTTLPGCATGVSASDTCDGAVSVTCTPGSIVVNGCVRSQTFTYTATDACGNTASASVTYTWKEDTTPPEITCLGDIVVSDPNEPVFYSVSASDACNSELVVTCTPPPGSMFSVGTTTVTCVATDACGNSAQCIFSVQVELPVVNRAVHIFTLFQVGAPKASVAGDRGLLVADFDNDRLKILQFMPAQGRREGEIELVELAPMLVGDGPVAIAVADFDRDDKTDVVVANSLSNDITILMGKGNGEFERPHTIPTGTSPSAVAVSDFDSDAILDLVVACRGEHYLQVFKGHGDGTFEPGGRTNVGIQPTAVALGDFNRDGLLDVAVSNFGSDEVTALLGNGDGTFSELGFFPVGQQPIKVTVGDFNGDGRLDLATADFQSDTVSILTATNDGGFSLTPPLIVGKGPVDLLAGEFLNGRLGLAVASLLAEEVLILLGQDEIALSNSQSYMIVDQPTSIAAGDYNNDGRLDLSILGEQGKTLRVLLDIGNGQFGLLR